MMTGIKHKKGVALIYLVVILMIVVLWILTYFQITGYGLGTANFNADLKRAYYVADAGLAESLVQLRSYANPPPSFNVSDSNYMVGPRPASYSAIVVKLSSSGWPSFTITSTGTYNNISKTLQLVVQQTSASMFSYVSNSEASPAWGNLWWITGMYIEGPVHTNGQFNIWGDPIFNGPTSQVASTVNYWPGVLTNPNDFRGGLFLNAPWQAVFNSALLDNISTAAQGSGGLYLSGNSAITFNSDGTVNVTNSAKNWNNYNMSIPSNNAIYVNGGSVTVAGTVRGQVSVGSSNNIFISNNIKYNSDPMLGQTSTDLLALVANNDITVTAATAPAELKIEGVLVAINGSFSVDNWWASGKNDMLQFGALINNVCGPTGVFDPSTGTLYGGYNQLQYYDTRLQTLIPPCFPPATNANGNIAYTKVNFKEF